MIYRTPPQAELDRMFRQSVLLRPGVASTGGPVRVRSRRTPEGIECLNVDCTELADARHEIQLPHDQPRWAGEKVVWAFCSERCRLEYARQFFAHILGKLQAANWRL